MRDLRGKLLSVAVVLAAVAAVAVVFPFDAISFTPSRAAAKGGEFAVFVSLTPEEEAAAMKAAKSSWNAEAVGVRRMRAELFMNDLPESASEPSLNIEDRLAGPPPPPVTPGISPYLPSRAAPPPKAIPADKADAKDGPAPAFPREELLKLE